MRIDGIASAQTVQGLARSGATGAGDFASLLGDAMQSVDSHQRAADTRLSELASGRSADIHGTMIALQEADITLRALVSVRDKVVDGYQQLMNMNI